MPSILSHPAVPLALGLALGTRAVSPRLLLAGAAASVLPDLDVLAFRLGIPYAHEFGHRGASHSFAIALCLGAVAAWLAPLLSARRWMVFWFVAVSAASHGVLDALTNGGHGVALFWPFSGERHFLPWQVIDVSPLSLRRFFGEPGVRVLLSELRWVWLPCLAGAVVCYAVRRWHVPPWNGAR